MLPLSFFSVAVALLAPLSEAVVSWRWAELIGPHDIKDTNITKLNKCTNGCFVFVSTPAVFAPSGADQNIYVAKLENGSFINRVNISHIASLYQPGVFGAKGHVELEAGDNFYIRNTNAQLPYSKFAVYVVSKLQKTYVDAPTIYDAYATPALRANGNHVTILSALHYTVNSLALPQQASVVTAYATGSEAIDKISNGKDRCNPVYQASWTGSIGEFRVRTPLFTMLFDNVYQFDYTLLPIIKDTPIFAKVDRPVFSMSYGYIGCWDTIPFRWNEDLLLPIDDSFHVVETVDVALMVDGELSKADCVRISQDSNPMQICQDVHLPQSQIIPIQEKTGFNITWHPKNNFNNASFSVRVEPRKANVGGSSPVPISSSTPEASTKGSTGIDLANSIFVFCIAAWVLKA